MKIRVHQLKGFFRENLNICLDTEPRFRQIIFVASLDEVVDRSVLLCVTEVEKHRWHCA